MHFAIRFLTEYDYDTPVTDNLNALRVRPATTSTQRCDEFHTRIDQDVAERYFAGTAGAGASVGTGVGVGHAA